MLNHDPNDERWEAEYWDDFAAEFGPAAYAEARYMAAPTSSEEDTHDIVQCDIQRQQDPVGAY